MYSRFFGHNGFHIPLENMAKLHTALNILTIINIILSLLPMIFIDIYGLIKYSWGNQFYIIMIETLVLSLFMLAMTIWEFKQQKKTMKEYEGEQMVYA
jgi:hypothetical protein